MRTKSSSRQSRAGSQPGPMATSMQSESEIILSDLLHEIVARQDRVEVEEDVAVAHLADAAVTKSTGKVRVIVALVGDEEPHGPSPASTGSAADPTSIHRLLLDLAVV